MDEEAEMGVYTQESIRLILRQFDFWCPLHGLFRPSLWHCPTVSWLVDPKGSNVVDLNGMAFRMLNGKFRFLWEPGQPGNCRLFSNQQDWHLLSPQSRADEWITFQNIYCWDSRRDNTTTCATSVSGNPFMVPNPFNCAIHGTHCSLIEK